MMTGDFLDAAQLARTAGDHRVFGAVALSKRARGVRADNAVHGERVDALKVLHGGFSFWTEVTVDCEVRAAVVQLALEVLDCRPLRAARELQRRLLGDVLCMLLCATNFHGSTIGSDLHCVPRSARGCDMSYLPLCDGRPL